MTGRELDGGLGAWTEAGLMLLIALTVSLLYSRTGGDPLFWDEYYHLLAARSWAENGTLTVGEGAYTRGAWLSIMVGWLFRTFGESVSVARLPGVMALSLWALTVFVWVRAVAGRTAAWLAALSFCLSPLVLINTVMVRFYGMAGLLFWLGCVAIFLAQGRRRFLAERAFLVVASLILLWACLRITPPAKLWVACLALWLAGVAVVEGVQSRRRVMILGGGSALLVLLGIWAYWSGWLPEMWGYFRRVPAWGMGRGGDLRWYEHLIRQDYPAFWTLLPVAAILAVVRRPLAGTMCTVGFGAGLVLLSLSGSKGERFILPLLPFFFVLWGIAIAELIPGLRSRILALLSLTPLRDPNPTTLRLGGHVLLAGVLVFALLMTPGFSRVRHVLTREARSLDRVPQGRAASPAAWEEVGRLLSPVLEEVDVVITANSLQTLYHVGSYDFAMRGTVIPELHPPEEFGMDLRTGRPAISALESLKQIMDRENHGLVFGERFRWRHPWEGFTDDVTDYILANMEEVPLPEELGVIAYRW